MARSRRPRTSMSVATSALVTCCPVPNPAELLTVGPDHPVWSVGPAGHAIDLEQPVHGAIVRVSPPLDCSPELAQSVAQVYRAMGAAAVRLLPVRRSAPAAPERKPRRSFRDVVLSLVGDDEPVRLEAQSVMDEAGL